MGGNQAKNSDALLIRMDGHFGEFYFIYIPPINKDTSNNLHNVKLRPLVENFLKATGNAMSDFLGDINLFWSASQPGTYENS